MNRPQQSWGEAGPRCRKWMILTNLWKNHMEVAQITFPVWPRPWNRLWSNRGLTFTGVPAPSLLLAEDKKYLHTHIHPVRGFNGKPPPHRPQASTSSTNFLRCFSRAVLPGNWGKHGKLCSSATRHLLRDEHPQIWFFGAYMGILSPCLYNQVQARGKTVLCLGWNNISFYFRPGGDDSECIGWFEGRLESCQASEELCLAPPVIN